MISRPMMPSPGASFTASLWIWSPVWPPMIIVAEKAEAPAEVPATTPPRRSRSTMAPSAGLPPSTSTSRDWSPPVRNTPVEARMAPMLAATWASARTVIGT